MPFAPQSRCAQCLMVLAAQNEVEPPPPKPMVEEAIGYRLAQDPPTIHDGASVAAGLAQAQREDPTCHEVIAWFGGDPSPARPPTLRPEETVGELQWFNSRFDKLRLVHYRDGTILLAILTEARQGEEAIKNEKNEKLENTQLIVPASQRTAVIKMAHSKAH